MQVLDVRIALALPAARAEETFADRIGGLQLRRAEAHPARAFPDPLVNHRVQPLERTAQRNFYRTSVINLIQQQRSYEEKPSSFEGRPRSEFG